MTRLPRASASLALGLVMAGGAALLGTPLAAVPAWASGDEMRPTGLATPAPIAFPADHGPHDRLTEWWYYSGHLESPDGHRFGFEYVIFRARRDPIGLAWASHLAVTDETAGRFVYDQRLELGDQVDRSHPDQGFDLAINGDLTPGVQGPGPAWIMTGGLGSDHLDAQGGRAADGQALGLTLDLQDDREPMFHGENGYVTFDASNGSYYYSRPRMTASGSVTFGDQVVPVSGSAWFDHQWGDFRTVGDGWDWFAVNLDDGSDLMVSVIRAPDGGAPVVYGTVRDERGIRHLGSGDIVLAVEGEWTSPHTAISWPAGWRLEIPREHLRVDLRPTVGDQELDTRATTQVIYWEGSQTVKAERDGVTLGGEAYVELTGYGPGATAG
jgi:predicted secreted hydrolase